MFVAKTNETKSLNLKILISACTKILKRTFKCIDLLVQCNTSVSGICKEKKSSILEAGALIVAKVNMKADESKTQMYV